MFSARDNFILQLQLTIMNLLLLIITFDQWCNQTFCSFIISADQRSAQLGLCELGIWNEMSPAWTFDFPDCYTGKGLTWVLTRALHQWEHSQWSVFFEQILEIPVTHVVPDIFDISYHEVFYIHIVNTCWFKEEKVRFNFLRLTFVELRGITFNPHYWNLSLLLNLNVNTFV